MVEGSNAGEAVSALSLEFTPTWIVAAVCSVIVLISLLAEFGLHYLGKVFKKNDQKPLYDALQKIKEELMLLGFISLLLTVFQGTITKMCIHEGWTLHMLPCKKEDSTGSSANAHFGVSSGFHGGQRRLLSGGEDGGAYCMAKGKVPLLSLEAIHQLHIFIFVLALTHVVFSALTVLLGVYRIREWKSWENSIKKEIDRQDTAQKKITLVPNELHSPVSVILRWLKSFVKQFYGSVTKSDYTTIRLGFVMTHCRGNPKFDFHKYMIRALEADFKKVVGISWFLWVFVVIFLLLNVNGWQTYFWISFLPLILLLAVGTKLEHVITQLVQEVAEKHSAIEGDLVVKPSDDHFWFSRPHIVLHLIHFILFQNSFEIAFFFWILTTYGFDSCIMGQVRFIVPRLVIGVIIQVLCSYSTLPLYAIVTQMGTYFKKAIFDEHMQGRIVGWAEKIKAKPKTMQGKKMGFGVLKSAQGTNASSALEMQKVVEQKESIMEEGKAEIIATNTFQ